MNVELARKLEEAGFPQAYKARDGVHCPNLTELVAEYTKCFGDFDLKYSSGYFHAMGKLRDASHQDTIRWDSANGRSAEEAMGKLYLYGAETV